MAGRLYVGTLAVGQPIIPAEDEVRLSHYR